MTFSTTYSFTKAASLKVATILQYALYALPNIAVSNSLWSALKYLNDKEEYDIIHFN